MFGIDDPFIDVYKRQPIPCVKPEISTISLDFTHLPSSGMGAGPWLGPFFTTHMCLSLIHIYRHRSLVT